MRASRAPSRATTQRGHLARSRCRENDDRVPASTRPQLVRELTRGRSPRTRVTPCGLYPSSSPSVPPSGALIAGRMRRSARRTTPSIRRADSSSHGNVPGPTERCVGGQFRAARTAGGHGDRGGSPHYECEAAGPPRTWGTPPAQSVSPSNGASPPLTLRAEFIRHLKGTAARRAGPHPRGRTSRHVSLRCRHVPPPASPRGLRCNAPPLKHQASDDASHRKSKTPPVSC